MRLIWTIVIIGMMVVGSFLGYEAYTSRQKPFIYIKLKSPNIEIINELSKKFLEYNTDGQSRIVGDPIRNAKSQAMVNAVVIKYSEHIEFAVERPDKRFTFGSDEINKANFNFSKKLHEINEHSSNLVKEIQDYHQKAKKEK